MRRKTRTKVKKALKIAAIIIGIIAIIIGIFLIIELNKEPEISYDDGLVCSNYFTEITIDLETKEVKRDDIITTLSDEFGISEEEEEQLFLSSEEMYKFLSNSVFEISQEGNVYTLTDDYQTKTLFVEAKEVTGTVEGEEITEIADDFYMLEFYSEKLTKAMYSYYKEQDYIEEIYLDEVYINETISEISQTVYGETVVDLGDYNSLGVSTMGLDNYQSIINENGNPSEIIVATIGYGINYQNDFFENRITDTSYNFMLDNEDITETISQGSRIAEVLVDSTTSNVKIMALVTVTDEGYTSISSIVKALDYAIEKSDIICYELINSENEVINKLLERAFSENVAVCAVSSSEDEENYPANHGMTIATSSIDRDKNVADYSGTGSYIDFAAPSTDVKEIFSSNSTVSRWSGPQYSNALIVASIAMVKTYSKDATIMDVYNFFRDYSVDLGEEGKDDEYGYGYLNFSELTIADIDKESPVFEEIEYENETWEVLKQVTIKASDNIRIYAWAVTTSENLPQDEEWTVLEEVTPNLNVTKDITQNGTYYLWLKDSAGNTVVNSIVIEKADSTPPEIAYTTDESNLSSGSVTVNITAIDDESGLNEEGAYSWDNSNWSEENKSKTFTQNGRYKVYVRDNLGNISEKEIVIESFPIEGTYTLGSGNLITSMTVSSSWTGITNNSVKITLNINADIAGWQLTNSLNTPSEFVNVAITTDENTSDNNTNSTNSSNTTNSTNMNSSTNTNTAASTTTITTTRTEPIIITTTLDADITYYLWVKDSYGNVSYQTLVIQKNSV